MFAILEYHFSFFSFSIETKNTTFHFALTLIELWLLRFIQMSNVLPEKNLNQLSF